MFESRLEEIELTRVDRTTTTRFVSAQFALLNLCGNFTESLRFRATVTNQA
jgi:hypothetical protein